jgi:hypothetical protein
MLQQLMFGGVSRFIYGNWTPGLTASQWGFANSPDIKFRVFDGSYNNPGNFATIQSGNTTLFMAWTKPAGNAALSGRVRVAVRYELQGPGGSQTYNYDINGVTVTPSSFDLITDSTSFSQFNDLYWVTLQTSGSFNSLRIHHPTYNNLEVASIEVDGKRLVDG